MIKNIIFDFGDVFINLDKPATQKKLSELGLNEVSEEQIRIYYQYEKGEITTQEFVRFFEESKGVSEEDLIQAWNAILLDFPEHRLAFLKKLSENSDYRLFLLSNTNDLHISWIIEDWGEKRYNTFRGCFEKFYLSHEIGLRKPNTNIYEFVLEENSLQAEETYFIDDTQENTDAANKLGIKVWNINPETDDITNLMHRKNFL